jgi:polysaccharide pyruvyl transferase WcaK-like protein
MVFLKTLFRGNIAISVGGDNYCYPWSANQAVTLNREIRKHAKATVLWGCSIDPEAITPEVREDLAKYDLITAREPITYELLKAINPNTIRVADPAFTLDRVDLPVPDGFIEGNTVGVNVSPLIMKYGTEGSLILANYENMIRSILEMTDMQVCLIPHVVWEHNDDREPCRVLYEKFRDTGRVCMVEGGNATQLKGYIARCRFFVGARTHATIAAYSTCVPTLVVGYSVKSRGIARDLFGTEENYVLPVQNLKNENHLADAFRWLVKQEAPIRQTLKNVIPGYIDMAKIGAAALKKLQ